MRLAILIAVVCGCTANRPGPIVSLVFDQTGVPSDVVAYTVAGASAWAPFDIGYSETPVAPECIPTWYDGTQSLPCGITIHIQYRPGSELGGAGLTADRMTYLQIELMADQLAEVAAHEVGHSVWNSADHVIGSVAIMTSPPTSIDPTDADRAYAKQHTIGWVP